MASNRVFNLTSSQLAQVVLGSQRQKLGRNIASLFTGEGPEEGGFEFSSLFGGFSNLFERALKSAFNRVRTRTSIAETERSRQAEADYRLSRGQRAADAAKRLNGNAARYL